VYDRAPFLCTRKEMQRSSCPLLNAKQFEAWIHPAQAERTPAPDIQKQRECLPLGDILTYKLCSVNKFSIFF